MHQPHDPVVRVECRRLVQPLENQENVIWDYSTKSATDVGQSIVRDDRRLFRIENQLGVLVLEELL